MKDNKVHIVNKYNKSKWNKPLFMSNGSDKDENLYWFGGKVFKGIKDGLGNVSFGGWEELGNAIGQGVGRIFGVKPDDDYGFDQKAYTGGSTGKKQNSVSEGAGLNIESNTEYLENNDNIGDNNIIALGGPLVVRRYDLGGSLGGSLGSAVGGAIGGAISSGYTSGAGNVVNTIGKVASVIPGPWGAAISGGLQVLGGGINALVGTKVDQAKLNAANRGTNALKSFRSSAANFDAIKTATAQANVQDAYSSGIFNRSWARKRNAELKRQRAEAQSFADRSITNNVSNLAKNQISDAMANYSALGGPIDLFGNNDMNATTLGLAYDLIDTKRKNAENKNQMTNMFMGTPNALFAFGGDMQSNSADWGTGLTHIDAGGSHEESPYDGVQMGVDNEGTPNLVEEGEVIYNGYVYSARILIDKVTKEKFHFPKKKEMTYAEAAKKLEKEIAEHPNDPISIAGFKSQMETLAEEQERQKQEMEAERAKAAFEALSPEEQTAIMQRAAQEEQMAQQAAQEQAIAEQQAMQQPSPEEAAMMQQQIQAPIPDEQAAMQQQQLAQMQANVSALGGQLVKAGDVEGNENLYALGDRLKKKTARKYGADWFKQLGKALGLTDDEMTEFLEGLNPNDPDANIAAFNAIYGNKQEKDARKRYMDTQRQSKRNELFGDNGMYRYSADKKYLYKGKTNDTDRTGYINRDYTGDEKDGSILGFLSVDDYNKKRADYEAETNANKKAALLKELEGYKPINEKAGDYMHDYQGKRIESLESDAEDKILDRYTSEYEKGFKWDPKEAQTVQYPVDMEHSNLSYLRYVPALSGAIGLFNDAINPTDYSRAQAVANLGNTSTPQINPDYKGNYLTYMPIDPWFWESPILASSRATDRAIMNTTSPSRNAALIANGLNTTTALGQAGMQGQLQNFERKYKTTGFNNDLDKSFMNVDLYAQDANQKAAIQRAHDANRYSYMGLSMMDDLDARKSASMSANLTNLLQSIGNIGEEAYDEDRLRWLERTGTLRSNYYRKAKYGGNIDRNKLKL